MQTHSLTKRSKSLVLGTGLLAASCFSGCQSYVGGQNLPGPYYLGADVQYHAPGPERKLSRAAALLEQLSAEHQLYQE